ncbi:hypothetical protein KDL01_05940 [Actinospica durhamensis]|uniref:Uncharacterized protein n=1 Tax=Actinospica durhamensis TaxID=1508375 RepID=A0A941ELL4_9ACTN|nr:hypothetical protein [Actinospica durhamensis]MBR7832792.1 hypothetical protein [Actinospica durhamensis]
MTETEITTGAQRAQTDTAEPTLTVSELRALLQDATAYATANRPVVLHAPAEPATAPQTAAAGHPGAPSPTRPR